MKNIKKIEVWKKLEQVMTKSLLAQEMPDEICGTK